MCVCVCDFPDDDEKEDDEKEDDEKEDDEKEDDEDRTIHLISVPSNVLARVIEYCEQHVDNPLCEITLVSG